MNLPADPGIHLDLSTIGYGGPWPAMLSELHPCDDAHLHGRVTRADRGAVTVATHVGTRRVGLSPTDPPPVTGDWVVLVDGPQPALHDIAPRLTAVHRPQAHGQRVSADDDQVLAANVDLVGVVAAADRDLNVRRLERGLVMAYESGATPVVLLTKVDLAEDLDRVRQSARATAPGVDVVEVSGISGTGVQAVAELLAPDRTLALLGASGVGKSTLTNALAGSEVLETQDVREGDGKGRHTTAHRELIALPGGGAIIDTPGLRTLSLGSMGEGVAQAFPEIDTLASGCRFTDCRHETEPGCAVLAALDDRTLDPERLEGFVRIRRDVENAALRADIAAWRRTTRSWGRVAREAQRVRARDR